MSELDPTMLLIGVAAFIIGVLVGMIIQKFRDEIPEESQ